MRPAEAIRSAAAKLSRSGRVSPAADARELLRFVTAMEPIELLHLEALSDDHLDRYDELVARRCEGVPLQHLTGEAYFRHVRVRVGPGVFVPRPETEVVAGEAIAAARCLVEPVVVELCAGSGAISAAVCDEVPGARVYANELSREAFAYLEENVPAAVARCGDMAEAFRTLDGSADVVVANPPYVRTDEELPDDVRLFDPDLALFGGEDGLAAIPVVAGAAHRLLRVGGVLVMEHGSDQGEAATRITRDHGFIDVSVGRDLTGRDRYIVGVKG